MDVLSEVLRVVRLSGVIHFNAEFSEPWAIISSEPAVLRTRLGAESVTPFHVFVGGHCLVRLDKLEPIRIQTGDVLAFATSIAGLGVTHTAFAYRDRAGILRVLHAPLSGGAVEITRATLPEYVAAIRSSTGILVARPLRP